MKKRICFVVNSLKFGGIQTALFSLINEIIGEFDIYLLSLNGTKESSYLIPNGITLMNTTEKLEIFTSPQCVVKGKFGFIKSLVRIAFCFLSQIVGSNIAKKYYCSNLIVNGRFDVAIAWSHNLPFNKIGSATTYICQKKINAKKVVSYIHTDYLKSGVCDKGNNDEYSKSDFVAFVSPSLMSQALEKHLPFNACVSRCLVNKDNVLKSKDEPITNFCLPNGKTVFVTVARLSEEKCIIDGVKTFKLIKDLYHASLDFVWLIVGDGPMRSQISNLVKQLNLDKEIILFGYDKNPYKYINKSDFYISFSNYEGVPITFLEAKYLNKRIISTKITSAQDILDSNDLIIDGNIENYAKLIVEFCDLCTCIPNFSGEKVIDVWNRNAIKEFKSLIYEND